MKAFILDVTPEMVFIDFSGREFVGKSRTSTFRASLGKFGQKSFAPQKICLLLYTYVQEVHHTRTL